MDVKVRSVSIARHTHATLRARWRPSCPSTGFGPSEFFVRLDVLDMPTDFPLPAAHFSTLPGHRDQTLGGATEQFGSAPFRRHYNIQFFAGPDGRVKFREFSSTFRPS